MCKITADQPESRCHKNEQSHDTRRVHRCISENLFSRNAFRRILDRAIFECERRSPLESSTNAAGKPLLPARYVRALSYSRPRYETKTKKNPILHCHDEGVIAKVPSPLYRRRERIASSETTRMASESEAIGPSTRELAHCSLVRDASHPEADPIGCVITGVSRYDSDESCSSNDSPVVGYERRRYRRDETGREEIARRRGAGRH